MNADIERAAALGLMQVLKQLEEAPLTWKGLKKRMFQRREQLAPLQQFEAIEVRRRSDAFSEKVGFNAHKQSLKSAI